MLRLMITGATQQTIASRLRVSQRTIEARSAKIRSTLAATTLYTLGVQAIRRHLVIPEAVLAHARRHHNGNWIEPTTWQQHMLRLLASGASDTETATALDVSTATVRRHVRALATANGAPARPTAGALFEALGWN